MQLNDYQEQTRKTAMYPNLGNDFIYLTMGLVGEAGEIANKFKKVIRDDNCTEVSCLQDEKRIEIAKELGDVLWYLAQLASTLNYSLEEVAQGNIDKLSSRMERGTISGSGDNR